jgi:5-(carboxyamino)imidazole ribonucleotide mutase
MLSINDEKIAEKLSEYKQRLEKEVSAMSLKLKEVCENE